MNVVVSADFERIGMEMKSGELGRINAVEYRPSIAAGR